MPQAPQDPASEKLIAANQDIPRKRSQTDAAYGQLKDMIVSGRLDPTMQIDAHKLVDVLGFGRTPVREALLRLQTEGIVRIMPKRGVRIVSLSVDEILEIYQVITAAETEAVRLLTKTEPSLDQLDPLIRAAERMMNAAQAGNRDGWIAADEEFHRQLLKLNPNWRLCDVGLLHRDLAQRAHFVALRLLQSEQLTRSVRQHKRLIKLIASGDAATAAETHQIQRDRGAKMLIGILRQYRLTQL